MNGISRLAPIETEIGKMLQKNHSRSLFISNGQMKCILWNFLRTVFLFVFFYVLLEVLEIWRSADAVCFDVDSTVCLDEGIDELAEFCGAGKAVAEWTARWEGFE